MYVATYCYLGLALDGPILSFTTQMGLAILTPRPEEGGLH